jgi:hypothetical protein
MAMDASSKTYDVMTVLSTGTRYKARGGAICADKCRSPRFLLDLWMLFGDGHRVSVEPEVEAWRSHG